MVIRKKWNILFLSIILFVVFDSFMFAYNWMPFDSRSLVFPESKVVDALIKNTQGVKRVFGNLGSQVETYYNIPSIEGYDPLYIHRYGEFARSSGDGSYLAGERSAVKLSRSGDTLDRLLDVSGVSFMYHPLADTNQGWAYPVWNNKDRFSLVFQDSRTQIYKNNSSMGRAVLFNNYEVKTDKNSIIQTFYSPKFDFRKTVILEQKPFFKNVDTDSISQEVNISSYTPNEVIIHAKTNTPALLFLSDNYYPGWNAYVDGKRAEILRANYTFRAVPIDVGDHNVRFSYEPMSLKLGMVSFILGLIGMSVLGFRLSKK